jgi:hypothetical protein
MLSAPLNQDPNPRAMGSQRVPFRFAELPTTSAIRKAKMIADQPLLSDPGKDRLKRFLTLLIAGELPVLTGHDVDDFLKVVEAMICPGRFAVVESDPTMISIEDIWCRAGAGVATAIAAATDAATNGAILVYLTGIERSGARFWLPSLRQALRNGTLPRGLLVCCGTNATEHDEIAALPSDICWLNITDVMATAALAAGPSLLSPPTLELTSLDPGPLPSNLEGASKVLVSLGFRPSLSLAMRIARVFAEAHALFGNEAEAVRLARDFAQTINAQIKKIS